ncbi:MAG TPA: flagellar FlbD family protein [Halanaerobiaceae bacterium]|nr:flagellar FlbD family protein [Halanaerobiaceae bacterium]HOA40590.1 flagellar FlbD family protein [Halanaerobiales bacterium]HPZ63065.1 flagellar FlbD family protein [Halanaerobiales bacterium]HQD04008.1 flagellar FlbD family protein [Halanaerobiales bacterium]
MIKVIKINGEEIVINAMLIESIQATPDTVITLTTNKRILVKEQVDEVRDKVIEFYQKIYSVPGMEKE